MRELWEDHIVWTRLAIISLTTSSPDTDATVGRLLANQNDIGNLIKPFYGTAAGARLSAELRRQILIAAELIAAAKAGNQTDLADAQRRWEKNADDNRGRLEQRQSAVPPARDDGGRAPEAPETDDGRSGRAAERQLDRRRRRLDRIHRHALHMADLLSSGLVKQFPRRFR